MASFTGFQFLNSFDKDFRETTSDYNHNNIIREIV